MRTLPRVGCLIMPGEISRSYYPVDPESVKLAVYFLDDAGQKHADPRDLAEVIQKAVEDYFLEQPLEKLGT